MSPASQSRQDQPRVSIASRLRLAFGIVAFTTIVAVGSAIIAFHRVSETYRAVSTQSFPATLAASHLRASTQELSADLTALTTVDTQLARQRIEAALR
jgi:phosphoglycerate-specific signal transduction histidine kinase